MAQPTVVFDVNETLLDMSSLDPLFADAFGDKASRRVWFAQTLQNAMAATIVGSYAPFDEIAMAALKMTARKRGVTLDEERGRRIMRGLAALPPHGDVRDGLTALRDAGYRTAVLAQATEPALEEQLERAKIRDYFDVVLSVDAVRRYKPAPEAYAMAYDRLGGDERPTLVSAHDWDIAGALACGWSAAFVNRHGTALNPLDEAPPIVAPDLRQVATALISRVAA